jgi:hypothetical protein
MSPFGFLVQLIHEIVGGFGDITERSNAMNKNNNKK